MSECSTLPIFFTCWGTGHVPVPKCIQDNWQNTYFNNSHNEAAFVNRWQFHSKNIQVICAATVALTSIGLLILNRLFQPAAWNKRANKTWQRKTRNSNVHRCKDNQKAFELEAVWWRKLGKWEWPCTGELEFPEIRLLMRMYLAPRWFYQRCVKRDTGGRSHRYLKIPTYLL